MKRKSVHVIILIIVVIVIIGSFYLNNKKSDAIKIGFIGPLTGDVSYLGQNAQAGVEMAAEEINHNGGINGKRIEVIYQDTKCDPKEAVNAVRQLINTERVIGIIGGLYSSETLAAAPIAEENKVVLISYCSSSPDITNSGEYIFRDFPSDTFQGTFFGEYLYKNENKRKVGVMYCLSDACVGIKNTFKQKFEELGGFIVSEESFDSGTTDVKTQLLKVKDSNPDAIFFISYTSAAIMGIKQYRELNMSVPLYGSEAWDDPSIWAAIGNEGDGIKFPSQALPSKDFQERFFKRIGRNETTLCGSQAYDAMKILSKAILESQKDKKELKESLYSIDYDGAMGKIEFDKNGDFPSANYLVKIVENGKPN